MELVEIIKHAEVLTFRPCPGNEASILKFSTLFFTIHVTLGKFVPITTSCNRKGRTTLAESYKLHNWN